mgnify:FL=1
MMQAPARHLPTLRQLRYLSALYRERHFGRAAARCFVTQSTLSAGIQELEGLLGVTLVDRSRRKLLFTPVGEELVERAERVLRAAEDFVEAAEAAKEPLSVPVRMGVIPTVAPFLLPRVLPKLRRAFPGLKLYLKEDLTARLVAGLHAGQLDLLLLALPCEAGEVESAELFEDPFLFACRADSPFAQGPAVPADRLAAAPLLLLEDGHCLRDHALEACHLAPPRQQAFAATSLHTLVQMVDNGLGVTLLPKLALDGGILDGTGLVVRPIAGEPPARRIGMIWRRGAGRRRDFRLLADFFREAAGEASPSDAAPERLPAPQALPVR